MTSLIKICGLSTPETLEAAVAAGADMVGFVRFPASPRHLSLEAGHELSAQARGRTLRVLLVVDPTDRELDEAVAAIDPDLVQLHGRESPERVAAIRRRSGRPVMKAIGIGRAEDLRGAARYDEAADRLLLDAKPAADAARPGGNGARFDWSLLRDRDDRPLLDRRLALMLSGGLTPENVADAVRVSGIAAVDVSSGVETSPGVKDPERIAAFVRAARAAFAAARAERAET